MADTDETFDPNDLDSIDALLDEAESGSVNDEVEPDIENSDGVEETPDATEASGASDDSIDELLEEAEDVAGQGESLDFTDAAQAKRGSESSNVKPDGGKQAETLPNTDEFLAKRASAQSNNHSNMAAKDMDAIKKQITIFGAVLIVLVLIAIGMSVWSALAAKAAAMDEETFTIIESNLVRSELNSKGITESTNIVKSLDKKLDALSFQLEGLIADVARVEAQSQQPLAAMVPVKSQQDNKHATGGDAKEAVKNAAQGNHVATPANMQYSASSPLLLEKVSTVNSKMIKAQRRIDEVNRRVKTIQTQYKTLLHSVKTVEKQLIMQQAALAEKEKAKEAKKSDPYQYKTPDSMFYDQSVSDSYP